MGRRLARAGVVLCALLVCLGGASARTTSSAPGAPGALSHFDLARKDCLGTARNTASKVWYTVAGGVLSDVYYPTVDNTNVETLQYVVTDGSTFTDLQTRDMTYKMRALDPGGMECRVTATAKSGRYQLATDYLADPSRNVVLIGRRSRSWFRGVISSSSASTPPSTATVAAVRATAAGTRRPSTRLPATRCWSRQIL